MIAALLAAPERANIAIVQVDVVLRLLTLALSSTTTTAAAVAGGDTLDCGLQ